jgi:hypothetical protein
MVKKLEVCSRCKNSSCLGIAGLSKCKICNELTCYSEDYDAYFCVKCNVWLEKTCGDKSCEFCSKRLSKPVNIEIGLLSQFKNGLEDLKARRVRRIA